MNMIAEKEIFQRSELLLGAEAMERIAQKRVIVFGVGGVGSWCAESLVRSGIRQLTIVDSDSVCASNINRQLMATIETVGQVKVDVLRQRLLTINPAAEITAIHEFFTAETAERFHLDTYDYIIDAIDSLKDKALLILMACETKATFFASMGAALKLDPTRIKIAEFWKIQGDPLARALRKRFKALSKREKSDAGISSSEHEEARPDANREGQYPSRKFLCVYSDELIEPQGMGKGSLVHITAIFGHMLAGLVIQDVISCASDVKCGRSEPFGHP